jgi:hypothetical protein
MYKTGDLILVRNKGWIFSNIRKMTGSEFDHVGMLYVGDTTMVIDATPLSGVSIRGIEVFWNNFYRVYRFKSPYQPVVPEKMVEYCKSKVGSWYDIVQALCLYIMIALRIKRELDPIDMKNAFVCSELVSQAGEYAGVKFMVGATDRVTPADIVNSGLLYEVEDN